MVRKEGSRSSVLSSDTRELIHLQSLHTSIALSQTYTDMKINKLNVSKCLYLNLPTLTPGFLNDWQVRYLKPLLFEYNVFHDIIMFLISQGKAWEQLKHV